MLSFALLLSNGVFANGTPGGAKGVEDVQSVDSPSANTHRSLEEESEDSSDSNDEFDDDDSFFDDGIVFGEGIALGDGNKCPKENPFFEKGKNSCSGFLSCNYGPFQTCCNQTFPTYACECIEGEFQCFKHDTCKDRECAPGTYCMASFHNFNPNFSSFDLPQDAPRKNLSMVRRATDQTNKRVPTSQFRVAGNRITPASSIASTMNGIAHLIFLRPSTALCARRPLLNPQLGHPLQPAPRKAQTVRSTETLAAVVYHASTTMVQTPIWALARSQQSLPLHHHHPQPQRQHAATKMKHAGV